MQTILLVPCDISDSFGWYLVPDSASECRVHLQGGIPDTFVKVRKRSIKICVIKWMSCSAWCYLRSLICCEMYHFVNPSYLLKLSWGSGGLICPQLNSAEYLILAKLSKLYSVYRVLVDSSFVTGKRVIPSAMDWLLLEFVCWMQQLIIQNSDHISLINEFH